MTTPYEVALLRLVAHRLVGPDDEPATDVVRRLTAVQAQDLPGALTSVALRTLRRSRAEVVTALAAGEVVRTWPMRGTLHLVAAEDAGWMLRLMAPRVARAAATRQRELGLDDEQLRRAHDVAGATLAGGRQLRRKELFAAWGDAGVSPDGQRGVHLLRHLAMAGTLVLGPLSEPAGDDRAAQDQLVVLLDEWIPQQRPLEGEEALGEIAGRYLRGHGPATVADLARWTGLTMTDARTGAAVARGGLAALDVDGTEHLLDPATPDRLADARAAAGGVLLLPGFDELLLGYADRSAVLDPAFTDRIVPGGNGVFRPTVLSAGRVVGTWSRTGRPPRQQVAATPFESFDPAVDAAVPDAYAALPR